MAEEHPFSLNTWRKKEYFDSLAPMWDNMVSPDTEALARLEKAMARVGVKPGNYVLDIGSGTGILAPLLTQAVGNHGMVIAMDISDRMLIQARGKNYSRNIYHLQADVMSIPMPGDFFDVAICYNAFPHFNDKPKSLAEIARVVKAGGKLVIGHTQSRKAVNDLHQGIGGLIARDLIPEAEEVIRLLSEAGFQDIHMEDHHSYLVIARRK